jgi:hypothetical protein
MRTTESDNHRTTDFLGIGGFYRRPPEWMKAQLHRISVPDLTVELPHARMKIGDKTHSVQTRNTFTKKYKEKLNSENESHHSFYNLSPVWELKNIIKTADVSTSIYSYVYIRNFASKRRTWFEFQKEKNWKFMGKNKDKVTK